MALLFDGFIKSTQVVVFSKVIMLRMRSKGYDSRVRLSAIPTCTRLT